MGEVTNSLFWIDSKQEILLNLQERWQSLIVYDSLFS